VKSGPATAPSSTSSPPSKPKGAASGAPSFTSTRRSGAPAAASSSAAPPNVSRAPGAAPDAGSSGTAASGWAAVVVTSQLARFSMRLRASGRPSHSATGYMSATPSASTVSTGSARPRRARAPPASAAPSATSVPGLRQPRLGGRAGGGLRPQLAHAQRLAHAGGELEEALRLARLGVARVRQVDVDHLADAPGARRHHHHLRAQEHRLGARVGHEHHRLVPLLPDAQQL